MAAGGDAALRLTVFRAGRSIAQSAGAGDAGRFRLPSDGGPDKGGSAWTVGKHRRGGKEIMETRKERPLLLIAEFPREKPSVGL